jgi:hypothetical protein
VGATSSAHLLAEGRVVGQGTPDELLQKADLISAYLGEAPAQRGARTGHQHDNWCVEEWK